MRWSWTIAAVLGLTHLAPRAPPHEREFTSLILPVTDVGGFSDPLVGIEPTGADATSFCRRRLPPDGLCSQSHLPISRPHAVTCSRREANLSYYYMVIPQLPLFSTTSGLKGNGEVVALPVPLSRVYDRLLFWRLGRSHVFTT